MSYYIRLFTTSPLSTLIPLQAQMIQRGYQVNPVGTNQLEVFYDPACQPLRVELTDSTNTTTQQEIAAVLDAVSQLPGDPNQHRVLDVLARTLAVVAVGVPDDYHYDSGVLDDLTGIIANAGDGLFQADGDGFYDQGQLILELK